MTSESDILTPPLSTGGRIRRSVPLGVRLFRSHLAVGGLGVVMLVLAVVMMLHVRLSIDRLTHVRVRATNAVRDIALGVERSHSALRGWVAVDDESLRQERADAWSKQIRPQMKLLRELFPERSSVHQESSMELLAYTLEDLCDIQWRIEDVAHTPGNEPAQALFSEELAPVTRVIFAQIDALIEIEKQLEVSTLRRNLFGDMADFRSVFARGWSYLSAFVVHETDADATEANANFDRANHYLHEMKTHRLELTLAQQDILDAIAEKYALHEAIASRVVSLRLKNKGQVASTLLVTAASPMGDRVHEILGQVSDRQMDLLGAESEAVDTAINFAIAMSLCFVAVTMIATVYLSRRAGQRVTRPVSALTKAAAELAAGTRTEDIPIEFDDEIGRLTKTFNAMRLALENAKRELASQKFALDEHALVSITDLRGRITYVNERLCDVSKYSREQLLGRDHRILNSGHHPKAFFAKMWDTILRGDVWSGRIKNRAKDGTHYWVDSTIVPFKDSSKAITQFVAIRTDVTAQVMADDALRSAKQAAEQANVAKSSFLANMSHEIRTPMTAILGFTENLLDPDISEDVRVNAVQTIHRNGKHLIQIINDVLDVSKIDSGNMTVERIPCPVCDVAADVISLMRPHGLSKGLDVSLEYNGSVPETIHSDPTRLRQILLNLLNNSIKFTKTGSVRLILRLVEDGDTPLMQFDVIDTGIGKTADQAASVFDPFVQADTSTTRSFGGTGLGLTISQWLAVELGGSLAVHWSECGKGTQVRLQVSTGSLDGVEMLDRPAEASKSNQLACDVGADADRLAGLRILVAEDGLDNQRLILHFLSKAGAAVDLVDNGRKALDKAMAATVEHPEADAFHPYDVVLMDMQMPVVDGYTATRNLRARAYTGLIIALTAHAMEEDRRKCLAAGCDDFVTKPIDRKKLIELLRARIAQDSPTAIPLA